jgi:hypothetical protein
VTPNAPGSLPDVNDIFADFAAYFAGQQSTDGEIAHPDQLDRSRLDGSLDSLRIVDAYLAFLHSNRPEEMTDDWARAMLWGGAYLGEVIRRHAQRKFDWIDFDDFVAAFPQTTTILGEQKGLGWCALLTPGGGGFTLPVNKMMRFLFEGPEESVYVYALHEIAPPQPVVPEA